MLRPKKKDKNAFPSRRYAALRRVERLRTSCLWSIQFLGADFSSSVNCAPGLRLNGTRCERVPFLLFFAPYSLSEHK